MVRKIKVSICGDKKSDYFYNKDCEMTLASCGLNVVKVESLPDEIDKLDDDGFDDDNDEFRDWKYFYNVDIESDLNDSEFEAFIDDNLSYYELEKIY